jgi:hypothetical protein
MVCGGKALHIIELDDLWRRLPASCETRLSAGKPTPVLTAEETEEAACAAEPKHTRIYIYIVCLRLLRICVPVSAVQCNVSMGL